ncbi:MAG: hypothetical protein D6B26_07075 [Spirochaetaceae bacterium]|nr:MAG: hypothetical protein D6B26_07075 [Spirochaetaceae bacterium]
MRIRIAVFLLLTAFMISAQEKTETLESLAPVSNINSEALSRFSMDLVSSEDLLEYAEQRLGVYSERTNARAAIAAINSRMDRGESPYLEANIEKVEFIKSRADQYDLRWAMEENLYALQQDPASLVQLVNHHRLDPSSLTDQPGSQEIIMQAEQNSSIALQLLAIFAAYELSLGQWEQASEILSLARKLPNNIPEAQQEEFDRLAYDLDDALFHYRHGQLRVRPLEGFIAITGFGLAAAALADLIIPSFSIPNLPGTSSARSAALAGTAAGGTMAGFAALALPPIIQRPPIEALTEYLAAEWGHLIEGSIQLFEDTRNKPNQLIILSLIRNRFVVFSENPTPRELPGVFEVNRTGKFRLQVSHGKERISTPATDLHEGINLVPLEK